MASHALHRFLAAGVLAFAAALPAPAHAAMMGEDLEPTLDAMRPYTRHIQFADAPGRGEPGTGQCPLEHLFQLIESSDFRGWVSAEYRPTCETKRTLRWFHTRS